MALRELDYDQVQAVGELRKSSGDFDIVFNDIDSGLDCFAAAAAR